MGLNIIGDVAGRHSELMLLLSKMPKGRVILLGDLNDRGPRTRQVITYCLLNNILCVKSNHGDMLINAYNLYHKTNYPTIRDHKVDPDKYDYVHYANGGDETLRSYGGIQNVPKEHIEYLVSLPWYIQSKGLFLSHAPWHPDKTITEVTGKEHRNENLLWNRTKPKARDGLYQIHGHNSYHEVYFTHDAVTGDKYDYGMCVDNCHKNQLIGVHWPTKEIFTQNYVD